MADGRGHPRAMLDAQLERDQGGFDGTISREVATPVMRAFLVFALRAVAGVGSGSGVAEEQAPVPQTPPAPEGAPAAGS